jgi:hypothetical protein
MKIIKWYYDNIIIISKIFNIILNFIIITDDLYIKISEDELYNNFIILLYNSYKNNYNYDKYLISDEYIYFDIKYSVNINCLYNEIKEQSIHYNFNIFKNKKNTDLFHFIYSNIYFKNNDDYHNDNDNDINIIDNYQ